MHPTRWPQAVLLAALALPLSARAEAPPPSPATCEGDGASSGAVVVGPEGVRLLLTVSEQPPSRLRVSFDRIDGQPGLRRVVWDPFDDPALSRAITLPEGTWQVVADADPFPFGTAGSQPVDYAWRLCRTSGGKVNAFVKGDWPHGGWAPVSGDTPRTIALVSSVGGGSNGKVGEQLVRPVEMHSVTLRRVDKPDLLESASGLATAGGGGAPSVLPRRAFGLDAASVSAELLEAAGAVMADKARVEGLEYVRAQMERAACESVTFGALGPELEDLVDRYRPIPRPDAVQPVLENTCTAIGALRMDQLASAGEVLLRALLMDAVQLVGIAVVDQITRAGKGDPFLEALDGPMLELVDLGVLAVSPRGVSDADAQRVLVSLSRAALEPLEDPAALLARYGAAAQVAGGDDLDAVVLAVAKHGFDVRPSLASRKMAHDRLAEWRRLDAAAVKALDTAQIADVAQVLVADAVGIVLLDAGRDVVITRIPDALDAFDAFDARYGQYDLAEIDASTKAIDQLLALVNDHALDVPVAALEAAQKALAAGDPVAALHALADAASDTGLPRRVAAARLALAALEKFDDAAWKQAPDDAARGKLLVAWISALSDDFITLAMTGDFPQFEPSLEVPCASALLFATMAECQAQGGCDARAIEDLLADPSATFDLGVCESQEEEILALFDRWGRAESLVQAGLDVLDPPRDATHESQVVTAATLAFDLTDLSIASARRRAKDTSDLDLLATASRGGRTLTTSVLAGDSKAAIATAADLVTDLAPAWLKTSDGAWTRTPTATVAIEKLVAFASFASDMAAAQEIEDAETRAAAQKEAIRALNRAATDRDQRRGQNIVSLGGTVGTGVGVDLTNHRDELEWDWNWKPVDQEVQVDGVSTPLRVPIGIAYDYVGENRKVGAHAELTPLDVGRFVSWDPEGAAVVDVANPSDAVRLAFSLGATFGRPNVPLVVGGTVWLDPYLGPTDTTTDGMTGGLLFTAGFYVPLFDLN